MKKTLALLFSLALAASAVSCSKNSDSSESLPTGANTSSDTPAIDIAAAANGTNYTKGTLNGNVYTNEYAHININIPEELHLSTEKELSDLVQSTGAYYTDEKNQAFEAGTIWDGWITNENNIDNIFIRFVNTKTAFPNSSDVTADDALDIFKERNKDSGANYEPRTTITLGGEEYTKEAYNFEAAEFQAPYFNYLYARKLDDSLLCLITVSSTNPECSADYFETMFG